MSYGPEQLAFQSVLVAAANRAIVLRQEYDAIQKENIFGWYSKSLDVASSGTVLNLLATIDKNWPTLIRTYEGPGK